MSNNKSTNKEKANIVGLALMVIGVITALIGFFSGVFGGIVSTSLYITVGGMLTTAIGIIASNHKGRDTEKYQKLFKVDSEKNKYMDDNPNRQPGIGEKEIDPQTVGQNNNTMTNDRPIQMIDINALNTANDKAINEENTRVK